jgi:hypothetical protein
MGRKNTEKIRLNFQLHHDGTGSSYSSSPSYLWVSALINESYAHSVVTMDIWYNKKGVDLLTKYSKSMVHPFIVQGWNFFSVLNHNDKSYGKGVEIDKGIYDINGFQIRFFTKKEIKDLAATTGGFEIIWIKEEFEEPVTLYLVSSKKP